MLMNSEPMKDPNQHNDKRKEMRAINVPYLINFRTYQSLEANGGCLLAQTVEARMKDDVSRELKHS
jgi:hypothetical protein